MLFPAIFLPLLCGDRLAFNQRLLPLLLLCLLLPVALFLLSGFPVSLPPLFPVPSLSPSRISPPTLPLQPPSLSFRSGPEARGSGAQLWRRVLFVEAGKTTPSRFRLFSLKLAAGVAYLTRAEIPVVERQGVALITSAAATSCRLIERMSRNPFDSVYPKLLLLSGKMISGLFLPRLRCS